MEIRVDPVEGKTRRRQQEFYKFSLQYSVYRIRSLTNRYRSMSKIFKDVVIGGLALHEVLR
jgi:hypothetical protein